MELSLRLISFVLALTMSVAASAGASASSMATTTVTRPVDGSSANRTSGYVDGAHGLLSNELVEKVQEARAKIEESEVAKRKILGTIYTIQQRMKRISHEKNNLTDELYHVQDSVKGVAKLIAVLEKQIEGQRKILKHRLSALYKLSGEGYVAILFSQESPLDMDEALRNLKTVTQKDYALIRSYQDNVTLYKSQRKKLKVQVEHLVSLESRIKTQEGLLAKEHQQKSQIVSELDRSRTAHIKKIRAIRDDSKRAAGLASFENSGALAELLKPSIFEQKGQLPVPVQGRVIRDFGMITNDRYKLQLSHKGWLFDAAKGAAVTSVFDGAVAFASWIKGYGQVVIIDHSDHYYTVYAHITRVKVKTGDTISKGQVIAEIGAEIRSEISTPHSTDESRDNAGLYFEIRHFSEPENPTAWLALRGVKMALRDFPFERSMTAGLNSTENETDQHARDATDIARAALKGEALVEDHQ